MLKNWIVSRGAKMAMGTALSAGLLGFVPSIASADRGRTDWNHRDNGHDFDRGHSYDHRDFDHHDFDHHDWGDHDRGGGSFSIRIGSPPPPVVIAPAVPRVWVPDQYQTVTDRVWVPDQYQMIIDHVWVAPVTQAVTDRVWVPDQFAWADVDHVDANGRHYSTREKVVSVPGHFEEQTKQVVVTPGHYEDVPRQQLVAAGHFEDVTRQELICAGHWEDQPVVVAPPVYRPAGVGISLRIPIGR